jgi:hypothetical protein
VRRRLTGITGPLGAGGATRSAVEAHLADAGLRNQAALPTGLFAENGAGLLITLEEIHRNQISELRELATTLQHAFREECELAFVGAGLALAVSDVVNDEVLTFLRRAERHHLGSIGREDVARAIREPVEANGRQLADDVLAEMVEGTRGYPFLIQLVGARVWRRHPSALADASDIDKSYLLAMARDDGPFEDGGRPATPRRRRESCESVSPPSHCRRARRARSSRLRRLRAALPARVPPLTRCCGNVTRL